MRRVAPLLPAVLLVLGAALACADDPKTPDSGTFTLWQLPNQTTTQMMSYVIRTVHGKVIVIDGGRAADAPYLTRFLTDLGGRVEDWYITHPHDDHFGALTVILGQPATLQIGAIRGSLPDDAWMAQWGDAGEKAGWAMFTQALAGAGRSVEELSLGQKLEVDGVRMEVLGVKNPEITKNPVNNSSLVLRMSDAGKSVLFLGDLGLEGGEKLLKGPHADRLPCDYVQMAHHGQNGVGEAVYQRARPSYCLWPTPLWLWDNNKGGGVGSGSWKTLEVRAWMDKMPVKRHYVMFEGIQEIR